MGGTGVIDSFLGVFTSYIDSGFGLLGGEVALNYYRVSAVFDCLFKVINSREIWPEMPFEKGEYSYG